MTKSVIIFSDFDGTITNRRGGNLVFTPFFQSLLLGYEKGKTNLNYKRAPILSEEGIVATFREKFGTYGLDFDISKKIGDEESYNDIDILMSKETLESFHALLKNPHVSIRIITKNRIEYTKALFKYQGFSDTEINRLQIIDDIHVSKGDEVKKQLQAIDPKADFVYVLDDDQNDCESMFQGVKASSYNDEQIKRHQEYPGQFNWKNYLQEINEITSWYEVITSTTEPQIPSSEAQTTPEQTNPGTAVGINNTTTEITTPQTTPTLADRETVEKNQTQNPEVMTSIKEKPAIDENRTSKIVGIFATVGFVIGFAVGVACVFSGGLAPFGVGILGALGFGALTGLGVSGISALFGYDVAKGTEPDAELDEITVARSSTIIGSNGAAYVNYYASLNKPVSDKEPIEVAHHPSVYKKVTETKHLVSTNEGDLDKIKGFRPDFG